MSIELSDIFFLLATYFVLGGVLLGFRKKLSKQLSWGVSIILNIVGLSVWWQIADFSSADLILKYEWISIGASEISFSFLFNPATWLMVGLSQFIGLGVQLFSIKYMADDSRFTDYFAFLNLFIGSMLGLVMANNLMLLFAFWELVGFCSYLLIGFWFHKKTAVEAASKAFLVNKVGDSFLLIAIGLIFASVGTLEIDQIKSVWAESNSIQFIEIIGVMLVLGSLAKSAQLPLQIWLPDAMEGPTPVSALIHAATMVAAGIFMLARMHFALGEFALHLIAIIGAISALMAGYSALFQWDIKNILAYSTISQLGMMMVGIGISQPDAALFHLFTHAFYKAGLFLIAGILIFRSDHEQDIRAIDVKSRFLFICYLICAASLAGLPLFSGYFSKETLMLSILSWDTSNGFIQSIVFILFLTSGAFTAIYCTKIGYFVFIKNSKLKTELKGIGMMELVVAILSIASIFVIHSLNPIHATAGWFSDIFTLPELHFEWVGYLSVLLSIALIFISFRFYQNYTESKTAWWSLLGQKHFYLDLLYTKKVVPFIIGSYHQVGLAREISAFDKEGVDAVTDSLVELTVGNDGKHGLAGLIHKFDINIIDRIINGIASFSKILSRSASKTDIHLVDGIINGISKRVDGIGFSLRKIQSGKLQGIPYRNDTNSYFYRNHILYPLK